MDFLRQFDSQVPSLNYNTHDKFFCGIVLRIENINYYAPISHDTSKLQTSIVIKDKDRALSSIKFSFMVPAPNDVITRINFKEIAKMDQKYADLLQAEYAFCSKNAEKIYKKAESVYRIGCNEKHALFHICCKYKILEQHMNEYGNNTFFNYKGFVGSVEFSEADGLFYGKVLGIRSLVSYEGGNVKELEDDFHGAVDDYIACSEEYSVPEAAE